MAESIKNQVDALTGFAGTEDLALQDWCESGVLELINIFTPELKEKCMTETTLNNSSPTMDLDGVGKILYVSRLSANSGGYRVSCRKVPSMYSGLTSDSSSLLYYGTVTDPVYWIQSTSDASTLNVYPSPEATQTARVYHVAHPQVNIASSEIGNFPDEAGYLVVLYAACRALHRKMNDKSSNLPSDIPALVLSSISTSLPTYTSPSDFVLPIGPASSDVDFSSVGTIESFASPIFNAPTLGAIASMSLPSVPVAPSLGEKSVTITGTAPTYNAPVLSLESLTISDLNISSVAPVAPSIDSSSVTITGTAPTYVGPVVAPNYADIDNWITTEEDSEMAAARIQAVGQEIQEYGANMQNQLNVFNKENAEYQAKLQKDLQDAQLSESKEGRELQRYATDLQVYQADINKEVQEYQQNMQKEIQIWQGKRQTDLQKYQSDMQNNLNTFNKENAEYQAKLQKDMQDAQLKESKESRDLQKYQADSQMYAAEVTKEVQRWTNEVFGKQFQEWTQKYNGQIQEYSNDIQKETARVNASLQGFQAQVGKATQKYQAETGVDMAKYQADVQANVSKYQSDMSKQTQEFNSNLQKYQSEIQKVTESNQSSLGKFGQDIANYGAKVQKHSVDYQWLQAQYAQLKQDYNQGIQMLIGGGQPAPQQQKGEG